MYSVEITSRLDESAELAPDWHAPGDGEGARGMDAHEWRYEHLAHENEECVCKYGDPSLCLRSEKCEYIHLRKHDPRDDPRDD